MQSTERADEIVRGLASQLGVDATPVVAPQEIPPETRGTAVAVPPRPRLLDGRADNVVPLTASMVGKRLEDLLGRAGELAKQAETLATALAGPGMPPARGIEPVNRVKPGVETLFSKQMNGLDLLSETLDTLGRALERANRALG